MTNAHKPQLPVAEKPPLLRTLLLLTLVFGKFGALTFGGGYAIVALMEETIVQKYRWLTSEELLNLITIGESTPGPIAVNTATFIGYRLGGLAGSIVAVTALVFPAWLIIVLISTCYLTLRENVWVAAALNGVRLAAIVLILRACLKMGKKLERTPINLCILTVAFLLAVFTPVSALYIITAALLFGIVQFGILAHKGNPSGEAQ
ncbi:MAG: chromate transporter [Kiritimatiellae bacterium]|nr:chromate transporter [Kiritimatiellia bacterium]